MKKIEDMSLDEIRDELARMDGWKAPGEPLPTGPGTSWPQDKPGTLVLDCWTKMTADGRRVDKTRQSHDVEPTLDGAAAALPEGWLWTVENQYGNAAFEAAAMPDSGEPIGEASLFVKGPTELHARYALAVAVRRKMQEAA